MLQNRIGQEQTIEYSFQINKLNGAEPYFLEVSPLRDAADKIEMIFIAAMVLIIDPNNPSAISLEPLKTLFNLTSDELNVAGLLLQGNTLMNVSEIKWVAIDTAKLKLKLYMQNGGAK